MAQTSELRDRLELLLSIPQGDSYVDSTSELQDINEAYRKTSYAWNWPQFLVKRGARILSGQKKYPNPSTFRKFDYLYVLGAKFRDVGLEQVHHTFRSYAVDQATDEFIISTQPASNGTQFTITNAESAGNAVTVEVNSVSGLAVGDEIVFPDDANPEVTYINAVDSSAVTITCRLDTSKSASAVFYKGTDNIMFSFYRLITALSASTDEPLLPADVHFSMLYYAAYLAYTRLEQYDRAEKCLSYWKEQMEDYWRAMDSSSTGPVTSFAIQM